MLDGKFVEMGLQEKIAGKSCWTSLGKELKIDERSRWRGS
jgi:hypothetical protein